MQIFGLCRNPRTLAVVYEHAAPLHFPNLKKDTAALNYFPVPCHPFRVLLLVILPVRVYWSFQTALRALRSTFLPFSEILTACPPAQDPA